jgi:neurofibromin 1
VPPPSQQQQYQQQQQQHDNQQPRQNQAGSKDDERGALVMLRIMSFFWVNGPKLSRIIKEVYPRFLPYGGTFRHTLAAVMPLLVIRWLDRFPREFVQLHKSRQRLEGGVDVLFDMVQALASDGTVRRRTLQMLYPLQMTLLFLMPDVFEVAGNLREARSAAISRRVAFLDGLRKAIRNRNNQACYSLLALLRAARHFDADNEAAIATYALDVKSEVRDAVLTRPSPGSSEPPLFEQGMLTAAFVSLADINLEGCIEFLLPDCLQPASPQSFKVAVMQGCSYFVRQPELGRFRALIDAVVPFFRAQLKVSTHSLIFIPLATSRSVFVDWPLPFLVRHVDPHGDHAKSPRRRLTRLYAVQCA